MANLFSIPIITIDISYTYINISCNTAGVIKKQQLTGNEELDGKAINSFFSDILPNEIKSRYTSLSNQTALSTSRWISKDFDFIKAAFSEASPQAITTFNTLSREKLLDWPISNDMMKRRAGFGKITKIIQSNNLQYFTNTAGDVLRDTTDTVEALKIIKDKIDSTVIKNTSNTDVTITDINYLTTLFTEEYLKRFKSSLDNWSKEVIEAQKTKIVLSDLKSPTRWTGGESNNKTAKIYK